VNADEVLAAQATLRIDSGSSTQDNCDEDIELDDDELLALGPPQLVRNPNTTLLRAIAQEALQAQEGAACCTAAAAAAVSAAAAAATASINMSLYDELAKKTSLGDGVACQLNEQAGLPGMCFTLLPKSSRGLTIPLSDDEAFLTAQREVATVWDESTEVPVRQELLRCLEESSKAQQNVLALQKSHFLFAQQDVCLPTPGSSKDSLSEDSFSNRSPMRLARKSPVKTPETVKFSEHVNASSTAVRQDCLLLGASDCAISFLGTGCAIPSKYRNVSGILVRLSADSSMLLDCGEGTWQQLVRMTREHPGMCQSISGHDNNPVLSSTLACRWLAKTIKAVWISHPHADHHLGLMTLVAERKRHWSSDRNAGGSNGSVSVSGSGSGSAERDSGRDEIADDFVPLLVIAPPSVLEFLNNFTSSDMLMRNSYIGIDNHAFEPEWAKSKNKIKNKNTRYGYASSCEPGAGNGVETSLNASSEEQQVVASNVVLRPVDQQLLTDIGIQSLENVKVHHCFQSFGVRIQAVQGWSLVYSGDTRPCSQLIRLGRGATILIHEATFDDTKPEEAVKKRHSTISEAVQVAKDMDAHRLILTHFSQRYPSMPPLPEEYQQLPCGLLLAFDFMNVKFSDLLWTHTMNPALLLAFPPESDVAEDQVMAPPNNNISTDEGRARSGGNDDSSNSDTESNKKRAAISQQSTGDGNNDVLQQNNKKAKS
jgi:ribonuclease BN (tRNA processing enzyme)